MEASRLVVTSSPHLVAKESTKDLMLKLLMALTPAAVAAVALFGLPAAILMAVSVAACVGFEYLYATLMKQPVRIGDLSAVCTGLLLAFNLPATLPPWMAVVGAAVAIIVVKMMFGGIGYNFANPAIVARIVLAVSFAGRMTTFVAPNMGQVDALASATPLAVARAGGAVPYMNLLLGTHTGMLGETCSIALLLGGIFLIATKVISPVIPAAYLGTAGLLFLISGKDPIVQLMSGGILLGAFFMATDYVTSPFTVKGKWVFGIGLGLLTWAIRMFGTMTEGVSYSILLMNLFVPYINALTRQKPIGFVKTGGAKNDKK